MTRTLRSTTCKKQRFPFFQRSKPPPHLPPLFDFDSRVWRSANVSKSGSEGDIVNAPRNLAPLWGCTAHRWLIHGWYMARTQPPAAACQKAMNPLGFQRSESAPPSAPHPFSLFGTRVQRGARISDKESICNKSVIKVFRAEW